ncbi:MFS transporter [Galbitalea sp. SE-J8]|uniref:MFS transporter n=1 Tax=Galbitalea sp. SE-J8 TaxID=3054952 RepID=UPI00338F8C2F
MRARPEHRLPHRRPHPAGPHRRDPRAARHEHAHGRRRRIPHHLFFINLPVGLLATLAARAIPAGVAPARRKGARPDGIGIVLLALGLFGVLFGLDRGESGVWGELLSWLPIAIGALLLAGYVLRSRRTPHPALDLRILRDRSAALSFALCAAASIAAWSILFLLPVFLQHVQGHSALMAGLALLPQGILTGLGTVLGQRVGDGIGIRWTVIIGFAVLLASSFGLLVVDASTSLWLTSAILAARSAAIGLVITPLLTVVNLRLKPDEQADANTVFTVVQRIAGSLGIGLLAGYFATQSTTIGPVDALHRVAIVIAAIAGASALGAVLLPRRSSAPVRAGRPAASAPATRAADADKARTRPLIRAKVRALCVGCARRDSNP